jgi:hypothetical protein
MLPIRARRGLPQFGVAATRTLVFVCIIFLTVAALLVLTRFRESVTIRAAASASTETIESSQGRVLVDKFEALAGTRLTRRAGPAVFMIGTWEAAGKLDSGCQIQLATHSGYGWQLFAWAGDPQVWNGTINSWGTVLESFSDFRNYQDTIILPVKHAGQFMLVWGTSSYASEVRIVRARVVYACGDADRHPQAFDVAMDMQAR